MNEPSSWRSRLRWLWPMLAPLLLGGLVFYFLREPLLIWRDGEALYDEQAMMEWVREARIGSTTLPDLIRKFVALSKESSTKLKDLPDDNAGPIVFLHAQKRAEIYEMLQALCLPPSKIYTSQLPLFPFIYRLEVRFSDELKQSCDKRLTFDPIVWDSENPRHKHQFRELKGYRLPRNEHATIEIQYQLHAYMQKQLKEREDDARRRLINIWVLFFASLALLWMLFIQRREAERDRQRQVIDQQIQDSKQKHLEEELRRQEAERKQEEAERQRLEEELRRQEAEREKQVAETHALELKSQMFHNIGVMAKSYAHNIKNLLVRPNDLLRRCLDERPSPEDGKRMLGEIQQTLGTVTERLQEILQTVQRDPNKFERKRVDLNALIKDLHATWSEQAESKWKMRVELDLHAAGEDGALVVDGDRSHLQQTLENFLFNARDAISEMRNHLRKQARPDGTARSGPLDVAQRQALIAAAGWRGRVIFRTMVVDGQATLEVEDNGIGMSEETRRHCTESHYSTKRNNALYAGLSAGMGLGLSFVQMILEHHGAALEIYSEPMHGARFRIRFPTMSSRAAAPESLPISD